MASRSSSRATVTSDGTTAWSIGVASIRSSWAIVRSATIRGAVRPLAIASRSELAVVGHVLRVGAEAGEEQLEPLRRVRRLELAELRQEGLRAAHLVDDLEGVDPLVVLDDEDLADHPEDVARDPVLDAQALVRDRAARRRACPRRTGGGSARPSGLGSGSWSS